MKMTKLDIVKMQAETRMERVGELEKLLLEAAEEVQAATREGQYNRAAEFGKKVTEYANKLEVLKPEMDMVFHYIELLEREDF